MPVWLAALLLIADLAALFALRKVLREKKAARVIATCVLSLAAVLLLGYLALTAIFLDAAYHK